MDLERLLEYYLPAKEWILHQYSQCDSTPLLGINAPQGTGKSTFARYLVDSLKKENQLNIIEISIDDFYLTREDQKKLAEQSQHPYLQDRGYPGTHDMDLMYRTLEELLAGKKPLIPRYNKSAHNGKGDRYSKDKWSELKEAPDLIILEGWMLGYAPLPNVSKEMNQINNVLEDYLKLNKMFNFFIHLHAKEVEYVLKWRAQAEKERRELGKGAMGEQEIIDYLNLFIPCYRTYNPILIDKSSLDCPLIRFELNLDRTLAATSKL